MGFILPWRTRLGITWSHSSGSFFLQVTQFIIYNSSSLIISTHRPRHHMSSSTWGRAMREGSFIPFKKRVAFFVFARLFIFCCIIIFARLWTYSTCIDFTSWSNFQITPNSLKHQKLSNWYNIEFKLLNFILKIY